MEPVLSIGNIYYCTANDLVNQGVVSYDAIAKGGQRGSMQWQTRKHPDDGRVLLVRWDTMAERYQKLAQKLVLNGLDPAEYIVRKRSAVLCERSLVERLEQVLTSDYRRFEGFYVTNDTSRVGRKTVICLARAAGVVELLADWTREQNTDPRSYQPYEEIIQWFNTDGNYDYYFPKGNQYLPLNPVKLKEKVLERTIGRKEPKKARDTNPLPIQEVIYKPRQGNKNRDEFGSDAELMAWVTMALMHGRKDPKAYIIRKVQEVCRIVGREVPSASWFSQVLASPKVNQMVAPHRHGTDSAFALRYTHSITMARAMYAGDCWMMDATRVNMVEHTSTDGKKAFLVVIAVRDAYSGEIVGCHFDTKEDRWGYTNALKMAVKSTGYLPHTLVHDRFPGHLTDEMSQLLGAIERKGTQLVCTHKATGKALLERWFDTLQTVFMSRSKYYYGQGIRSTREYAHRSPEYLMKLRKEAQRDGFNFDQAWQECWQCIEEYRQTPLSHYSKKHKALDLTPTQLHEQSEKPNTITLSTWDQAGLFWLTKVLDIRRNTISHEVHGVTHNYAIYDAELLYRYQRVAVKYEESDPSAVMLFAVGADDQVSDFFITDLKLTTDVAMYGPGADPAQLAKRQALGQRVADKRAADLDTTLRGSDQDAEYLLNMGRYVSKEAFETAQSGVLLDHMATVNPAPANATRAKTKAPPVSSQKVNISNHISY